MEAYLNDRSYASCLPWRLCFFTGMLRPATPAYPCAFMCGIILPFELRLAADISAALLGLCSAWVSTHPCLLLNLQLCAGDDPPALTPNARINFFVSWVAPSCLGKGIAQKLTIHYDVQAVASLQEPGQKGASESPHCRRHCTNCRSVGV